MILVKSKSKGFVGLLVSVNAVPTQTNILSPGTPNIVIKWLGVLLVDDKWEILPLEDLEPFIPELEVDKEG